MTGDQITVGTVAAAVASALVAGIMFAFSTSVLPGLGRRPAPEGIAAMRAMNATILPGQSISNCSEELTSTRFLSLRAQVSPDWCWLNCHNTYHLESGTATVIAYSGSGT